VTLHEGTKFSGAEELTKECPNLIEEFDKWAYPRSGGGAFAIGVAKDRRT
jgi:hypothetical protein